jgi:streptogramin lyase
MYFERSPRLSHPNGFVAAAGDAAAARELEPNPMKKPLVALSLALFALPALAAPRLKSTPIPTANCEPIEIANGPDGNVWFTEQNASAVARVTPTGVITEFRTPTFSFPNAITAGPDGNVWFGEGATGQIAFITPAGAITEIPYAPNGVSGGIVTGPDGNIWFTDLTGNAVWRLQLPGMTLTPFPVPTANAFPGDITAGADGNLWFVEGGPGRIGRITPAGVITEFGNGLSLPFSITAGPDGNVWFTLRFTAQLGRITPAGAITFFPIPAPAEEIAPGPNGTLVFTEFGGDRVARFSLSGTTVETPVITNSAPTGIVTAPTGTIWFLGYGSNRVYRLLFGPTP